MTGPEDETVEDTPVEEAAPEQVDDVALTIEDEEDADTSND